MPIFHTFTWKEQENPEAADPPDLSPSSWGQSCDHQLQGCLPYCPVYSVPVAKSQPWVTHLESFPSSTVPRQLISLSEGQIYELG